MKKFIKRTCLFLFLFISCDIINGQIINIKGLFLLYTVQKQYSEDHYRRSSFIVFLDSNLTKEVILKSMNLINDDSIFYSIKFDRKIYQHYGLYLNNIFFSSDSMASVLKSYAMDDFDSIIERNCIYNKHLLLRNKDEKEFEVYEYNLSYK
jgi:hypothetical protein